MLDYGKRYSDGTPVFAMLDAGKIVHSDLTAIIAGPFATDYPPNPTYPDRDQSFRELTIIYHDEVGAVQAFPKYFDDRVLAHTLHSVRDAFAINYGTGGIGSEILANRLGVGPMRDCATCKYEELFLSAWAVGDPAMVVDKPANACVGDPDCRATQALYPDDPSNVYHSYLWDHLKFRILHGGVKEHHIHHQHAHQWLYAPDSDESTYLDSQAIGPGAAFTLEMTYNGSGNKNLTVGDSIFHCHFYPHFAMGNLNGGKPIAPGETGRFDGVCLKTAPVTSFSVVASTAQKLLSGPLVYNQRLGPDGFGPLTDPTAILYVRATDVDANGRLLPGVPVEPLVLRANAGDSPRRAPSRR